MMEQEIIQRQKATIEALGARIAHMERTQTVTDASIRKLISQCTDYQNQVRELTKKLDAIRKAAA